MGYKMVISLTKPMLKVNYFLFKLIKYAALMSIIVPACLLSASKSLFANVFATGWRPSRAMLVDTVRVHVFMNICHYMVDRKDHSC